VRELSGSSSKALRDVAENFPSAQAVHCAAAVPVGGCASLPTSHTPSSMQFPSGTGTALCFPIVQATHVFFDKVL
jgi:hypothetical protein